MRAAIALAMFLAACSAEDDRVRGSNANCAFGGTLTDCERAEQNMQDACFRMVDCSAVVLNDEKDTNAFDWDGCVRELERYQEDRRRFVMACIASSTCDELRSGRCFKYGGE